MGKDCQARNLNKEDAMDRKRWKKQIRDGCLKIYFICSLTLSCVMHPSGSVSFFCEIVCHS